MKPFDLAFIGAGAAIALFSGVATARLGLSPLHDDPAGEGAVQSSHEAPRPLDVNAAPESIASETTVATDPLPEVVRPIDTRARAPSDQIPSTDADAAGDGPESLALNSDRSEDAGETTAQTHPDDPAADASTRPDATAEPPA